MIRTTSLLVTFLVVLATGRLAHAGSGVVIIGGDVGAPRRDLVGDAVREAATKAGWTLVPSLSKQATQALLACADPTLYACVPDSLASDGIDRLFVIKAKKATTESGEPQVILDATLIGIDPRTLVSDQQHCDHCADDQLRAETAALAQAMIAELAQRSGRTVLDVKTSPPGARIWLDSKEIGFSDARYSISPGTYQVRLELAGHLTKTIEIHVDEGSTKSLDETLAPSGTSVEDPKQKGARRSRTAALALGIGGLVGVAGGVTMVLVDQDPSPTHGRHYLNSGPWGYAVGGAGLLAVGIDVYLWRDSSEPASTPTVSFVPGGAVLGWSKDL